jgi:hypothetical protein
MKEMSFTERQGKILSFIHRYTATHGLSPSFEEIASHFGTTAPSVSGTIKALERRGFLSRVPGIARSLRVLVPSGSLPGSEFGSGKERGRKRRLAASAAVSPRDAAVAAALSAIEAMMEGVGAGEDRSRLVLRAASAVHESLRKAGMGGDEAAEAARRVAAEAARWEPGGQGITVRRRGWTRG